MKKIILFILFVSVIFFIGFIVKDNKNPSQKSPGTTEDATHPIEDKPEVSVTTNKTLDLSNQGLKSIPFYVFSETALEELNVSNNSLTGAIQAEIRYLSNLKILNASNNEMTGVPAEVGQLLKIEILDLSNNNLTGLPHEIGNLKSLKVLNISGNNYSKQDLDIIKKALPNDTHIIVN